MNRRRLYLGLVGQPAFGIAPTGQCIPAQGATLGKIVDKSDAF